MGAHMPSPGASESVASPNLLYDTLVTQFSGTLDELTGSRESIQNATKQVMQNPTYAESLIDIISKHITSTKQGHELCYFSLLDSIGQNASKLGKEKIVRKAGETIKENIRFVLESPGTEMKIPKIEKTITIWKARDIFPLDLVVSIAAYVETTKQRQNMSEEEKIIRKIEEIRRQQKQQQMEACLRNANENPFTEMEELMVRVEAERTSDSASNEVSTDIATYDTIATKNEHTDSTIRQPNPNDYNPHHDDYYNANSRRKRYDTSLYSSSSYDRRSHPNHHYAPYPNYSPHYNKHYHNSHNAHNAHNAHNSTHHSNSSYGGRDPTHRHKTSNTSTTYFDNSHANNRNGDKQNYGKRSRKKNSRGNSSRSQWEIPSRSKKSY